MWRLVGDIVVLTLESLFQHDASLFASPGDLIHRQGMPPTNQTMQELIYIATIAILISPLLCLFSFHSSRWLWLVACLTVVEHLTHPQKQKMVTCTQVIIIVWLINCHALNTRPLLPQFCFVACGDFIWRLNGVNWSDVTDCCTSS